MKYLGILRAKASKRVPKLSEFAKTIIKKGLFILIGFLTSRAVVVGDISPFGAAAVAAAPSGYILFTTVGAAFGYFSSGGIYVMRYIASLVAAAGIRWALSDLKPVSSHRSFQTINAFVSVFASSLILSFSVGKVGIDDILYFLAEGMLAGGSAYFFRRTTDLITQKNLTSISSQGLTCIVVSLGIMLIPVVGLEIYGFSVGRILVVTAILIAAYCGKEPAGAIAGIAAGTFIGVSGTGFIFLSGAYALGGLVAGIFTRFGKIVSALTFIAASCVIAVNGGIDNMLPLMAEIMAAAVIFTFIPKSVLENVSDLLSPKMSAPRSESLKRAVLGRLENASLALSEVSGVISRVSERLSEMSASDLSDVFNLSAEEVCGDCGLRACCWQTCLTEVKSSFTELAEPLRLNGRVTNDDLNEYLTKKCVHKGNLILAINRNYSDYTAQESYKRRVAGVRAVVNDQFEGMSELLEDISHEVENFERDDKDSAQRLKTALGTEGFTPVDVLCKLDPAGRMSVDIRALCFGQEVVREDMITMIEMACKREFEQPLTEVRGDEFKIRTVERMPYEVKLGAAQHVCNNGRLCGDAYEYFHDGTGRVIMMISDGMGSGGRAAIDSAMASSLMLRLLKGGFGFDCALKIVNSALLVKSEDETLATLDISCLNLYSGRADFFKAGAPLTLLRRGGKIMRVDTASIPAGILREVEFEHSQRTLLHGDAIMMFSDGAIVGSIKWLEDALLKFDDSMSPEEFSQKIVDEVCRRRGSEHDDDVTVLTAAINKRSQVQIMNQKTA